MKSSRRPSVPVSFETGLLGLNCGWLLSMFGSLHLTAPKLQQGVDSLPPVAKNLVETSPLLVASLDDVAQRQALTGAVGRDGTAEERSRKKTRTSPMSRVSKRRVISSPT